MSKKRKLGRQPNGPAPKRRQSGGGPPAKGKPRGPPSHSSAKDDKKKAANPQKKTAPPRQLPPTIPFSPTDRILLVGEGDLSFAASLITHHKCAHVTATVYEKNERDLLEKYPHAAAHIATIQAAGPHCKLVYNVDATKMQAFREKRPPRRPAMDRILFNFPHVGGKSTDVNRQVRHNQELLVGFFKKAEPSLRPGGSIVVTLFEGEPYTLWNVRDLGRHCGLQVERSFAFQAGAYPGYAHARTLGVVRSKKGEIGGGWRGEERKARSYVFVRKGEAEQAPAAKKKRRRGDDSDSESEVGMDSEIESGGDGYGFGDDLSDDELELLQEAQKETAQEDNAQEATVQETTTDEASSLEKPEAD